jgi:hypothetical protein
MKSKGTAADAAFLAALSTTLLNRITRNQEELSTSAAASTDVEDIDFDYKEHESPIGGIIGDDLDLSTINNEEDNESLASEEDGDYFINPVLLNENQAVDNFADLFEENNEQDNSDLDEGFIADNESQDETDPEDDSFGTDLQAGMDDSMSYDESQDGEEQNLHDIFAANQAENPHEDSGITEASSSTDGLPGEVNANLFGDDDL